MTYSTSWKVPRKKEKVSLQLLRFVILNDEHQLLGRIRTPGQWLEGFIELPTFTLESTSSVPKQYPALYDYVENFVDLQQPDFISRNQITKYRFTNLYFTLRVSQFKELLDQHHQLFTEYQFFDRAAPWTSLVKKHLAAVLSCAR